MPERQAAVFAALGDPVRLSLVLELSDAEPRSIARLSEPRRITRQAVSKHLGVLQRAGLVISRRSGRESRYSLRPGSLDQSRAMLDRIGRQWEDALRRLKDWVEQGGAPMRPGA